MKHIIVFGAGRSATALIDYLIRLLGYNNWRLTVADSNLELAMSKTRNAQGTEAKAINVLNHHSRSELVQTADLVISLLPPALHALVAKDCCAFEKHLLTASYVSEEMRELRKEIEQKQLLFLCEMGLDPGIDHMSAMQIIHRLKAGGAEIVSFRSHCGGLVAPESDNNPWHYKISWNSANVVKAGMGGAVFREAGQRKFVPYQQLFSSNSQVNIPGAGNFAYYPNRDSLSYIPVYGLETSLDFIRTTLRHPDFCKGWNAIIQAGLTDERAFKTRPSTFSDWSATLSPYTNDENRMQLAYLGLFDEEMIPPALDSSAKILQHQLEKKLMLQEQDKDMVIMLHEFVYRQGDRMKQLQSSLIVEGEDHLHTAMAKTVGLPLGIAAKLILQGQIRLSGLHLPVLPEIYSPVLGELATEGIAFSESEAG